jgi:hypothetical protein
MAKLTDKQRRDLATAQRKIHELQPGEKMARITVKVSGARLDCLVPGCPFWIIVPQAQRTIMEAELKDHYKDHRKHHHMEYQGRTIFEFALDKDYPREPADKDSTVREAPSPNTPIRDAGPTDT